MLNKKTQAKIKKLAEQGLKIPGIAKEVEQPISVVGSFMFSRQLPRVWDYGQRAYLSHILYLSKFRQAKSYNGPWADERAIKDPTRGILLIRLARLSSDNDGWAYKWNLEVLGPIENYKKTEERPSMWILYGFGPSHVTALQIPFGVLLDQKSVTVAADATGQILETSAYHQYINTSVIPDKVLSVFQK